MIPATPNELKRLIRESEAEGHDVSELKKLLQDLVAGRLKMPAVRQFFVEREGDKVHVSTGRIASDDFEGVSIKPI